METKTLAGRREYVISRDSSERIRILKVWFIILGLLFFTRATAWCRGGWRQFLLRLAGYSMPVYLFHELALTFLKKAVARLLPSMVPFQVLQYVGIPAVIIGGCILGSMILKKLLPRFYAVLTSGRT